VILGEVHEVTAALGAALASEGYRVRQVVPGEAVRQVSADRYEANLSAADQLRQLHELLAGPDGSPVGGVLNFLGLGQPFARPGCDDEVAPWKLCEWTFNTVKELEEDLRASAQEGGGWFVNFTALDGKFGLDGAEAPALAAAGTLGITKTLGRENPRVRVKNIDADRSLEPHVLVSRLIQELIAGDDLVEVGLTRHGRWRLHLHRDPVQTAGWPLPVDADSVVLLTGGAYGVTAAAAKGLAVHKPRLILVGRSASPGPEDSQTRGLDAADLRKRLIELARARGERVVPAEIERTMNRLLKDREIRANLIACQAAGAKVEYHALDVRNAGAFGQLLDDVYQRFGRLDGVIHGAGIIEDMRIRDKTPESFAKVFRTKVNSALTLANKLRPDSLKFLVFFASVSGRFGNTGQVDYSAANEFLNKLACSLNRQWPGRVVSINWGPWDGGMISDELRRLYASAGFQLIPLDEGVAALLAEIGLPRRQSPEVVISCSVEQMSRWGVKV
jgi:NAD(P)-dependent dehydrogenase (short-subunit alcohol dehydrogenase family)